MAKKKQEVRAYTEVGRRIAALGRRQRILAEILDLSQQTVSKKLRGESAILLSDLRRLAKYYRVPLTYSFEEGACAPELTLAWERIRRQPGPLQELVVLASQLGQEDAERLLKMAHLTPPPVKSGSKAARRR